MTSSSSLSDPLPAAAPPAAAWAALGTAGELLARVVAGGRIASAYLLEGADLLRPREGARLLASALVCRAPSRPCLECSACRRVATGSHPDVHVQVRDKATVISVEAMNALLDRAHASPLEGERQVFVVEPADAMAPEALATYLKTLEEPPPSTTFVLVTAHPERLPETVRSRCQRVRFPSASGEDVAAALAASGVDAERAARVATLSGASLARARRIAAFALDEAAAALVRAALARPPDVATQVDEALAALRARLAAAGEGVDPEAVEGGGDVPASESLRQALSDAFHALLVSARDRAAGLEGGILRDVDPGAAAAVLGPWSLLASAVRRNVSPAALWIEAGAALRRAAFRDVS